MKILNAEVINVIEASTKWGQRLVLNCRLLDSKEKIACWCNDLNNNVYLSKKPGNIIEVIQDEKGKFSLLDRETSQDAITMNRLSSNGSEGSYYTNSTSPTTPVLPTTSEKASISAERGAFTSTKGEESILDLPVLSDVDKRKMMEYIRSQSKLLKFCYDTVCKDFPTLEEYDSRGARSLAISLLISANQCRDRYLK
jgi:hypothetical protein